MLVENKYSNREVMDETLTGNMCLPFFFRAVFIYFCAFIKYFLMQPQGCQFVQIYRDCRRSALGNNQP